jgi:16S rRNA (guanine1207-N2)-methyltransferase
LQVQEQLAYHPEIQSTVLFDIDLPQASYTSFDQAALLIPKSRGLARRWLLAAYLAIKPGGYLYLAGPNDLGIRSLIRDAEAIFSAATILAYKKGNRIARLRRPLDGPVYPELGRPVSPAGVDWVSEPGIAPGTWQEFQFDWGGASWRFYSLPGVFSSDQLDDGTRLLLDQLQLPQDARVLDFGCGCGVIGIMAALQGAAAVDMVDDDLMAITSARKNITAHQLLNVRCLAGDGLRPVEDQRYTHILSNPPFHAARSVSYRVTDEFIAGSGQLLDKGGQMTLVANRFIPYEKTLARYYRKVTRLTETSRFQVLSAWSPKKIPHR